MESDWALYYLGECYFYGKGVEKDAEKAVAYLMDVRNYLNENIGNWNKNTIYLFKYNRTCRLGRLYIYNVLDYRCYKCFKFN